MKKAELLKKIVKLDKLNLYFKYKKFDYVKNEFTNEIEGIQQFGEYESFVTSNRVKNLKIILKNLEFIYGNLQEFKNGLVEEYSILFGEFLTHPLCPGQSYKMDIWEDIDKTVFLQLGEKIEEAIESLDKSEEDKEFKL